MSKSSQFLCVFVSLIFCLPVAAKGQHVLASVSSTAPQSLSALVSLFAVPNNKERFAEAVRVAKRGEYAKCIDLAVQTLESNPEDIKTKFCFIQTMVEVQKLPDTKHDVAILNEAIRVANELDKLSICNGSNDPELGFSYMASLGQLAYAVEPKHKRICAQFKGAIGTVAENLLSNPRVSKEAHRHLALPFFDKARAHAVKGESEKAATALTKAFELGFSDFERAKNEIAFTKLETSDQIAKIIADGEILIAEKKSEWAKKEIANFLSFPFLFDIDGLNDGRITNSEFQDSKLIVVDLWATWCPPCVRSIPHFSRLSHEFSGEKLTVLGISVDEPDAPLLTRKKVKEFAREHHVNYALGLGSRTVVNQVPGEMMLPMVLFLDNQGNVRYMMRGYQPYANLKAISEELLRTQPINN